MNWKVLKDRKLILAFTLAFVFQIIGIVLASNNNDFWVVFVVIGIFLTFYSGQRADRLYRQR